MRDIKLLHTLNTYHQNLILEKIIKKLKKIEQNKILDDLESGKDFGNFLFKNIYEMFAAKVQYDEDDVCFEAYQILIKTEIEEVLKDESNAVRQLLCYNASINNSEYCNRYNDEPEEDEPEEYEIIPELEIDHMYSLIYFEASSFTNKRIEKCSDW